MLAENIRTLSRSEKLLLINDLWDDVSGNIEDFPLSEEQGRMLDSRYKDFLTNPDEGMPWSEVKKNLKELL